MKKNKAPLYFFYRLLNSIRVYLNHNYIASLSRYYLELASGYIFNIKIYQFLSIVFIYVAVIPIQIDWSLYIEVFNNLSENLGTLRGVPIKYIKLESHINYILCSSHRSLLGAFFWTYILMVLILFIIFPILFIIQNYIFIILSILSVIFVKALALNFYKKHFQFFYSGLPSHKKVDFREKIVYFIIHIINNIGKIIKHLFKMWIISITIIFIFRFLIATMLLNLDGNNSFVSTILILTLPLPMFFYLLNFIVKYLKNESIEYKDYYLYNDYVVERVNMYRIAYTLIVNYFIRNYCIINISIIIKGFIAIILILFTICILYRILRTNKPVGSRVDPLSAYARDSGGRKLDLSGRSEPLALKSVLDTTSAAYIASFIALTPFLQEGINKGFIDFYNNKCDPSKNYDWKKIPFTKPGVLKLGRMGRTVNFMESDKHERYYLQNQKRQLDRDYLLDHYKPILDKSPIINMTWKLKYNEGIQRSKEKFTVKPINYFISPEFYGAVSLVLKGRWLVVNIIRHDSPGCVFVPTYYLPNKNDPNSEAKIIDTVALLESKYGIYLPQVGVEKANNRTNGLVIFTQAESIDNKSLFRVWRPSVYYNEPAVAKTVNNYYKEKSKNNFRIREFNTTDSIKFSKGIENLVWIQMEANKIMKRDNLSLHFDSAAVSFANAEYTLDNLHRNLVEFYLTKGQKANPSDFTVLNLDPSNKARFSYKHILDKALSETKSAIQIEKDLARNKRNGDLKVLENQWWRLQSNNEYMMNDCYCFKTRRDYPIDSLLLTRDQNHMAYFSIYKNGVVEGYKERQQLLGEIDSSINLPLAESRSELIKKIASKLTFGDYTSYKNIYGVSINRLTFEFFEVIRTKSDYFGIHASSSYYDEILDKHSDCEVYSIIDMKNDSVKYPAVFANGEWYKMTIPTHDYNMLDNRDELSIRRFMDFIYPNSDGELTYLSDTDNFSVLKDKIYPYQSDMDDLSVVKKKNVGFTKQAVDYKNKRPKLVNYTASAYNYRHFMGKSVIIPLPFDSTKLLDIIPHKYDKISLGGERVNFDYEPEQRVSSRPMVKFTKLGLEYRILNKVYTTKAINRVIKIEYYATWPNGRENRPTFSIKQALWANGSRDLEEDTLDHIKWDFISVPLTDEEASTELSDEIPGLVSTDEEEEDFYVYSGDKDDKGKKNREVVIAGQGKGTVPPNVTPLLARKAIEEEEDLYGYSGDEEDNGKKNRKVAIARRGSDKPRTVESPMELSFEDNLADMPYSYGGESSEVNDSNSGPPHCTGVASADQVGEGEPEVTLISADDIASEGDLAFSPQFFIPESTPDSISSYNYSPINMQANEEVGEILGSNLLNRGEAMEVDADLYREVMMNVEGQAVMETINPILLLPDLPISNPGPVECEDSPPSKEDSPLSDMSDREFFELEQEILNPKPSYSEEAPGEVVGSGQDAGEPEVIMISSDDSSSVSGDDSYCEASPITSAYKAGQIAEREAIIISPNADSSSEGGPTPPKKTDFIARPLNSPVAEVLHDITGTRLFTVDINTILTVISPYSRPEPYLWGVGYENYFISMASDLIYEHYPIDTVIPANNYQSKLITVYVPPAMKTSDAEDGAYGPPCRWGGPCPFESEHDRVHNKICDCSGNIVEFVHLVKLPRSNDIEGELFIKSVLSSEPLAGRDVMNRSNFSSDSYTKAYFVPEPSPDCSISSENSSISSDNSSPINTQANQEETGEPEVTLISADDIASEGDLAFSPQFFIPESTPDSISSYNYSPINMQANEEVGEILGSNLLNRGEAMEVDADLYREVMMNVEGQAVMETINPILLLPDLPISNPDPVECEDSPPSKEDSPLSDMSDSEFFELEQEILNLGKSIGRGNKGQSSTK